MRETTAMKIVQNEYDDSFMVEISITREDRIFPRKGKSLYTEDFIRNILKTKNLKDKEVWKRALYIAIIYRLLKRKI